MIDAAFRCHIAGDPRGKGSVRVYNRRAVKDAATESYMARCIFAMRAARAGAPPLTGALALEITAYLRRPLALVPKVGPRVRATQPPFGAFPAWVKPDVDNIAKIIADSLTQAGVIEDDARIAHLVVGKWWAPVGGEVGVDVWVARVAGAWP